MVWEMIILYIDTYIYIYTHILIGQVRLFFFFWAGILDHKHTYWRVHFGCFWVFASPKGLTFPLWSRMVRESQSFRVFHVRFWMREMESSHVSMSFQEIHEKNRFLELKVLEDFTKICVFHEVRQSPRPVNNMDNFSHLTVSQNYGTTLRNHTKTLHSSSPNNFKSLIHALY